MEIEMDNTEIVYAHPQNVDWDCEWTIAEFAKESTTAWIHIGNDFVNVYYQMFCLANIPSVFHIEAVGQLKMNWIFDVDDDASRFIDTGKAISVVSMINRAFMKHDRNSFVVQHVGGEATVCTLLDYMRERGNPL